MTGQEFGEKYLQYEDNIKKVLKSREIYDEDLLHDTYIALYEYAETKNWIRNFVNTFVDFYMKRYMRREEYESNYDAYDDEQMYHLEIEDESDLDYREEIGKRVDKLIRYYSEHRQKGERNHRRATKILRLYRQGLTEREISNKLKISHQAIHQSLEHTIESLKGCQKMAT